MTTYLITIFIVWILANFAVKSSNQEYITGYNQFGYVPNKAATFLIFLILTGLYTFRWCNGTDFYNYYMDFYSSNITSFAFIRTQRDSLFWLLTYIIKNFITDNFLVYNAVLGILTYAPILAVVRKYSYDYRTTLLLYFFSTAYFQPYNTVRQGIAVSFMLVSFSYLMAEKRGKFLLFSVIAFYFHPTSAITAVIFYLCKDRYLSKRIKMVLAGFAISGLVLPNIWGRVISGLGAMGQTKLAEDYADALTASTGMSILHVVVAIVPVLLIILRKNNLLSVEDDSEYSFTSFYMNSIWFYFGFVAMGLFNPIFARMANFYEPLLLIFYPRIAQQDDRGTNNTLLLVMIVAYFVYMIVVLPRGGNYVPYQFNHYSLHGIVTVQ